MTQKHFILMSLTLLISISVVLVLYFKSNKKMNYQYSSFNRSFEDAIQLLDTLNLKYFSYYFAGTTSTTVYLSNPAAPTHLLRVKPISMDTSHIRLKVPSIKYRSINVRVDSPYFYLSDGAIPFIYKGKLTERQVYLYMDSIYFINALPISAHSLALVALNNRENTLEKKTAFNPKPEIFRDILEEQNEGIFSTSGRLHYDKESSKLVYVYFYRNQYICMDTNFAVLHKSNTIDTISRAKITVGKISSENKFTMAAPPLVVNKKSCVSNNLLFINSNLPAKNEKILEFEKSSIIDVYDLNSNSYQLSFYIPPYKSRKADSFIVINAETLLTLHGSYLLTYKLNIKVPRIGNLASSFSHHDFFLKQNIIAQESGKAENLKKSRHK